MKMWEDEDLDVEFEEVDEDAAEVEMRDEQKNKAHIAVEAKLLESAMVENPQPSTSRSATHDKALLMNLEELLEKRRNGGDPVFSSRIWGKKELAKTLKNCFKYHLMWAALEKHKWDGMDDLKEADLSIKQLNSEIMERMEKLCGLPVLFPSTVRERNIKVNCQ